jgi:hypothetical protein
MGWRDRARKQPSKVCFYYGTYFKELETIDLQAEMGTQQFRNTNYTLQLQTVIIQQGKTNLKFCTLLNSPGIAGKNLKAITAIGRLAPCATVATAYPLTTDSSDPAHR